MTTAIKAPRRMPRATSKANTAPRSIYELHIRFKQFDLEKAKRLYPWAGRFVMGYPLPDWQREFVWSPEQKTRFITSIWIEIDIGTYLVNDVFEFQPGNESTVKFSDVLLDGQQRLHTLESYFKDEFPVPDIDGNPCFWTELDVIEQRYFLNRTFSRSTISSFNEKTLRTMYDLKNFGGTAHAISERASDEVVKA